jgi:hypothetical protein
VQEVAIFALDATTIRMVVVTDTGGSLGFFNSLEPRRILRTRVQFLLERLGVYRGLRGLAVGTASWFSLFSNMGKVTRVAFDTSTWFIEEGTDVFGRLGGGCGRGVRRGTRFGRMDLRRWCCLGWGWSNVAHPEKWF